MVLWIWRGLHLRVPDAWEMLEFSRNPQNGSCAFADRYRFRLQLSWRVLPGEPDLDRMISDTCNKLETEGAKRVRPLTEPPWRGLGSTAGEIKSTRYARFFAPFQLLVEVVFCWPEQIDKKLERSVLRSVELAQTRGEGKTAERWRAFGLDLVAEPKATLQACQVEPAHVEMRFRNEEALVEERFARRGMRDVWLHQPLDAWLRRWIRSDVTVTSQDRVHHAQHQVERLAGEMRRPGFFGRFKKPLRCDAVAWICPQDDRVYSSSRVGPGDTESPASNVVGHRFSCCERLGQPNGS